MPNAITAIDFGNRIEGNPQAAAALAQVPGSKVLDLTRLDDLPLEFLAALERGWRSKQVPRLALVFRFDVWAATRTLSDIVARQLAPFGTELGVFHVGQLEAGEVDAWLQGGEVEHEVGSMIAVMARGGWNRRLAMMAFDAAIQIARTHDRERRAEHLADIAVLALRAKVWRVAAAVAREAAELIGRPADVGGNELLIRCLRIEGNAWLDAGDPQRACIALLDAAASSEGVRDSLRMLTLADLGVALLNLPNLVEARTVLEEVVMLAERLEADETLAAAKHNLGCIELRLANFEAAEVCAVEAFAYRIDSSSLAARQDLRLRELAQLRKIENPAATLGTTGR